MTQPAQDKLSADTDLAKIDLAKEDLASSVAFVVAEVIYPQLLAALQNHGTANTTVQALLSSVSCPTVKVDIKATAFEFEPWDLSKNCIAEDLEQFLAQDDRVGGSIAPLLTDTTEQAEVHCWYCVEAKPYEHLKLSLAMKLSRA